MRFRPFPCDTLRCNLMRLSEEVRVHLWFWGWLVAAVAIAVVSAVGRDRASAPFAAGAGMAALLDALGATPAWQWIAFVGLSCALFVALNRRHHRPRHAHSGLGRHGGRTPGDDR